MHELFVWYRVRSESAEAALSAVAAMQAALCADIEGLVARLLIRSDDDAALQTWMEIYARPGHAAGVDVDMTARIEARAESLAGLIEGARHGETFAPMPSPDQRTRSIST